MTWGSQSALSVTESESGLCLGMPSIIHVTLGMGKAGDYRKIKEMQSLGRRGIH